MTNRLFVMQMVVVPALTGLYETAELQAVQARHPVRKRSAARRTAPPSPEPQPIPARTPQSGRMAVGSIPNMRRWVRVRCDESANPASWAAVVHEAPPIAASIATLMRSQSR